MLIRRVHLIALLTLGCATGEHQADVNADSSRRTPSASPSSTPRSGALVDSVHQGDSTRVDHSAGASILSCVERRDSMWVYHYALQNGKSGMVEHWELGYSDDEPQDKNSINNGGQLRVLPIRSDPKYDRADEPLPSRSYSAPAHWGASFTRVEETEGFFISWAVEAPSNELGLAPGARLSGFGVTLPRPDNAYLTGNWTLNQVAASTPMGKLTPVPCDSILK
jgi:hypothetical protein